MGDIDDGNAFLLQGADDLEKDLCLALCQRCRGLIHDDDFSVDHQSLGDFDHLLLADGKRIHLPARFDLDAQQVQDPGDLFAHGLLIADSEFSGDFFSQEHVLFHCQVKEYVQLLVDKDDARLLRFLRVLVYDFLPVHIYRAGVSCVYTRQNLHQCGLARAVLSHQGVDLTVGQFKSSIAEHRVSTE